MHYEIDYELSDTEHKILEAQITTIIKNIDYKQKYE
jgi:hypothetical protein